MRGQKCQVLQKLNISPINHSTWARARIIMLVLTIARKKGHIPATVTILLSSITSNSSMFGSTGRTKNINIQHYVWDPIIFSKKRILKAAHVERKRENPQIKQDYIFQQREIPETPIKQ